MIDKVTAAYEAVKNVHDGDTLMVGGFLMAGSPETLLKTLLEESDAGHLTVISNDTGTVDSHMIQIMKQDRVVKVNASYIGSNPMTGQMLINDPKSVTLYPQGTLAEKIRIGGAGIAGFYTPVGVGTIVEEGKERRFFDGRAYLLELPFHANVAFVKATIADKAGNCFMGKSTKNFGAVMARAADYVVVEAKKIVEVGELDPELVTIPSIFVDAVVQTTVEVDPYA